jgi:hypothetical protein
MLKFKYIVGEYTVMSLYLTRLIKLILLAIHILYKIGIFRIIRWKMYIWLPDYLTQEVNKKPVCSSLRHIIFVFVDHYEPGSGDKGALINKQWLENYRLLADRHRDSYGRKPQHTWFYPNDQQNNAIMSDLVKAVRDGYGEIEFHWHHKHDSNETFPPKLADGLKWFNRYGALIDRDGKIAFAFVHGNWSLDNSLGREYCGVTRELELLKKAGCFADFTFPALGSLAQPRKINSIYYAHETDQPKSYSWGVDAAVGKHNTEDLLIFQGPLNIIDYGALEVFNLPTPIKIDSWVDANIHVIGRPEWVFIKVHTHGCQSKEAIFGKEVDDMFTYLETKYASGEYCLHYVTAREAYNIVRAAENGENGNPECYLDYIISPPINKSFDIT